MVQIIPNKSVVEIRFCLDRNVVARFKLRENMCCKYTFQWK